MREETQRALKKLLEATKKVNELCHFEALDPNKPIHTYTKEEVDALLDAFDEEEKARKEYCVCLWQDLGLSQKEIEERLKRAELV